MTFPEFASVLGIVLNIKQHRCNAQWQLNKQSALRQIDKIRLTKFFPAVTRKIL